MKKFATALEVIPRTLAENAVVGEREGKGEDEVAEASDSDIASKPFSDGAILANSNSLPYPILDSLVVKHFAIKHATGAAVSVLKMDDNFRQAGGEGQRCISFYNFSFQSNQFQLLRTIILFSTIGVIVGLTLSLRPVWVRITKFLSLFKN